MSRFWRHFGAIRVSMSRVRAARARHDLRRRRETVKVEGRARRAEKPSFWRFAASSLVSTALDQVLAWLLFNALRKPLAGVGFLRILVSNVLARCVSLTLNYTLNHRLVFVPQEDDETSGDTQRSSRRESLPRFIALSAFILTLSTLGVFVANEFLDVEEWQAKIVMDSLLFFLNYNLQRIWVFRTEATIRVRRSRE